MNESYKIKKLLIEGGFIDEDEIIEGLKFKSLMSILEKANKKDTKDE